MRDNKNVGFSDVFNFLWDNVGFTPAGVFCALLVLAGGGIITYTAMGVQGRNCQVAHNFLNEDSYARSIGCFVHRMLNLLPSNFDGAANADGTPLPEAQPPGATIVAPPMLFPAPVDPAPLP
jgi:hypothetical protein